MRQALVVCASLLALTLRAAASSSAETVPLLISVADVARFRQNNSCSHHEADTVNLVERYPACAPSSCDRVILDDQFTADDVIALRRIAEKGMATRRDGGGPTILDLNTGYIRDSDGLENLFKSRQGLFSTEDFLVYGDIIRRLKALVESTFDTSVYFTAPTFITRLDGRADWEPRGMHDEYWHIHSDQASTPHYHYSGLLYLSTFGEEFTGT
jgi:hypothetical protein